MARGSRMGKTLAGPGDPRNQTGLGCQGVDLGRASGLGDGGEKSC